jgi:hypothetical protein
MSTTKDETFNYPNGQRCTCVMVSIVKRMLAAEIPGEFRLKFLEHLDRMPAKENSIWLTAEMIAAIKPICDNGYEIVCEARKLGAAKSLDVYAEMFSTFAELNPSIIDALKQSPIRTARSA